MGKHVAIARTTQSKHPWKTVVRSVFQFIVIMASSAPLFFTAITQQEPSAAVGGAAVALGVAAAITRVMALPVVEDLLRRFVPWLAAGSDADVE